MWDLLVSWSSFSSFLASSLSLIHSRPLLSVAHGGSSTTGRRRRWRVEGAQLTECAEGARPPATGGDDVWRQSSATGARRGSSTSGRAEATARRGFSTTSVWRGQHVEARVAA
jgi:hypothetical protein